MTIVRCIGLALLVAARGAWGATPDVDVLLQHLARPAPATTPFVEVHFSPLLSRPLIVAGELSYDGPDSLARTVTKPYTEHTEIHGDEVTVSRGSGRPRTFSLARAPELRILLNSFSALLGGNRGQLEHSFRLAVGGDEAHWSLGLTPLDAQVSHRVAHILVTGTDSSPRCMTTSAPDGSVTVMLMEAAAQTPIAPDVDAGTLEKVCR